MPLSIDPDTATEHLQEEGGFSEEEAGAIVDLLTGAADGTPGKSEEEEPEEDQTESSDGDEDSEREVEQMDFVEVRGIETPDKVTHLIKYTIFGQEEVFQTPPPRTDRSKTKAKYKLHHGVKKRLEYFTEYLSRRDNLDFSEEEVVERAVDLFLRSAEFYGDRAGVMEWLRRGLADERWQFEDW